ncbi:MAG TPA: transporter substrate-binding domain-containing protein [Bacteroidales bacterium]|nr:transporter substrate-binding domain-containing protein [Bacteroidales bacterium]HOU01953.1 transporter substrate-binding domain-containing protein [Bacteroidales bacterium]HQG62133.1 transporter substrate-binding domain-containing protein [Bacteroidales bacterium]HQK67762.1 transporter substrate-binding domain-containing protein [Bacteroidales bacterium]
MAKKHFIFFILLIILLSCVRKSDTSSIPVRHAPVSFDLDSIISRGRLIAVSDYNSTNYFIYKGEPMGFHFELLKNFTEYLGIDLEIIKENDLENAFGLLNSGEADVIAIGLTVSSSRKKDILFTDPIFETRQVLIQRRPHNWRSMTMDMLDRKLVRNQLDLAGKTVYVQKLSSHAERLKTLAEEIGDSIRIIEVPFDSEDLIRNVAHGEIEYTVCDENIATVNSTYYPDIDVNTPISFPQNIAWGVRQNNSVKLLAELNSWLNTYRKTRSFALLYTKYFQNSRSSLIVRSDYYTSLTGKISKYDDLIKSASEKIGWDWRLLASLIYQESRFNPLVRSRAGAYGLMQIMPVTGKHFGIDITASPSNNVKAGVMYINWLRALFETKVSDPDERLKFVLASYNAGPGHILDAMRLAEKNGMDPEKWDGNVSYWLQKKSDPVYYRDADVKSGYFRGTESVNFVSEILERFEHYKNMIPEEEPIGLTAESGADLQLSNSLILNP